MGDLGKTVYRGSVLQNRYRIIKEIKIESDNAIYLGEDELLKMPVFVKIRYCGGEENAEKKELYSSDDILDFFDEDGYQYDIISFNPQDKQYLTAEKRRKRYRVIFAGFVFCCIGISAALMQVNKDLDTAKTGQQAEMDTDESENASLESQESDDVREDVLSEKGLDINREAAWEDISVNRRTGKNQCNEDSITGQAVTVVLDTFADDLSEGELLDFEGELKNGLDMLDQPYAIGRMDQAGKVFFVFKTGLGHVGKPVLDLMKTDISGFDLQSGLMVLGPAFKYSEDSAENSMDYIWNGDGTYSVRLTIAEGGQEAAREFTEKIIAQGESTVFFACNNVPFLCADIDSAIMDGKFVFDRFCFNGYDKITDENIWLVKLINKLYNVRPLSYFYYDDMQFQADEDGNVPSKNQFGVRYADGQDMKEKIGLIAPDATVIVDDIVKVLLHLPLDEAFPEKAAMMAKDIYLRSGFVNSMYGHMIICLADETDDERARIYFIKSYDQDGGNITAGGIFGHGKFDAYREAFQKIIGNDPFFMDMTVDPKKWIYDFTIN